MAANDLLDAHHVTVGESAFGDDTVDDELTVALSVGERSGTVKTLEVLR